MDLISTSWSCARCGAAFISTPPDSGLCDDCTVMSLREIFYGLARTPLSASQADWLRDMATDAIAYRNAQTGTCPACQGTATEACGDHTAQWSRIQAYRQLGRDLAGEAACHER